MIIYHSMILWIAIMSIFYSFIKRKRAGNVQKSDKERVPMFLAFLTIGYIVFWAGIRTGVADTATNIQGFNMTPTELSAIWKYWTSDHKAPGFATFNVLFRCFVSRDYHIWLMTIAIASGIPIVIILRKHSLQFFYSAFLFIVTLNFFWLFNGIRQFLVAAILFYLSDWIIERKTKPFLFVVLLLSTIHFTALIMIPVYWIVNGKPFGRKMLFFVAALLVCIVFLEPFIGTLEMTLEDTAYSGFSEQFAMDDGVNPIRVMVMLVPPIIAYLARKKIDSMNDQYINLCVNMSVVCAGLYFLGVFTSGILIGRLPIYFELYNLILLPILLRKCFSKHSSRLAYILCTVGFFAFYYLQMKNSYYISDLTGLIGG